MTEEKIRKKVQKEIKKVDKTLKQLDNLNRASGILGGFIGLGLKKIKKWEVTRRKRKLEVSLSTKGINDALSGQDEAEIQKRLKAMGKYL